MVINAQSHVSNHTALTASFTFRGPSNLHHLIVSLANTPINVAETTTVIEAARSADLNIPSGCTFGVCGTCKVMKKSGGVHMVHNGCISEDDIEAGYILACCSNPIGKVEIEI